MHKNVYIVWLNYPNDEKRISAIFTTLDEARKYAERDDGQGKKPYECSVESERIYKTADEV